MGKAAAAPGPQMMPQEPRRWQPCAWLREKPEQLAHVPRTCLRAQGNPGYLQIQVLRLQMLRKGDQSQASAATMADEAR